VVGFLANAVPVAALAAGGSGGPAGCSEAETTSAMRACESARFQAAGRRMDAAYAGLKKRLGPRQKGALEEAQRAFLRYREANAEYYRRSAEGGTLAPLLATTTLADMTEARAAELEKPSP